MSSGPPSIAYDARQIRYDTSGLGRYTFAVLRSLLEQPELYGRLSILTDVGSDDGRNRLYRRMRELVAANPKASIEAIRAPLYSWRHHVSVARWVRRVGADRYFYSYFDLPLGVRCPTQFVLHDVFILQMPDYLSRHRRLKTLYYKAIVGHSLRQGHVECVTVSRTTAVEVRRFFGKHLRNPLRVALEAPVELDATDESPEAEVLAALPQRFLFYVGDRRPHKNLRRMLEIFRELRVRHGYPGEMILAGGRKNYGFDPEEFARPIPGVRFLGTIRDATRNEIFRRMESLVLLSRHEGFGLPIVEAGAVGAGVITSDSGAMKEVSPPWACLVDPESTVSAAAAAIATHLASPGRRDVAEYASRFSWHRCAREIFGTMPGDAGPHAG